MAEFEAVDPREFDSMLEREEQDRQQRAATGAPQVVTPPTRKLFFNEKTFRPPLRRVPCVVATIGGKHFDCPVLASYDSPENREHKLCILIIAEKPRIITTVALIPRAELERAPEVEIPS